jgi:hypothetical protein
VEHEFKISFVILFSFFSEVWGGCQGNPGFRLSGFSGFSGYFSGHFSGFCSRYLSD